MDIEFFKNALQNILEGYGRIISNGFDETDNYPVQPSHFNPCNQWRKRDDLYLVDESNGDIYFNDSIRTKRLKCLALASASPLMHAIGTVLNVANRVAKLVTFSHFWYPEVNKASTFKARLLEFSKDLLTVVFSPIFYLGLELSAIYGLILPYDGGKLYATFERCAYGNSLAAPCFQPSPSSHLGGGNTSTPNQW